MKAVDLPMPYHHKLNNTLATDNIMMIRFCKYHGTGNDFILVDNRKKDVVLTTEQIALLCHRHFGIGADGLMLLEESDNSDFRMVYYNADGNESTMCGNGGRCITAFAKRLNIIGHKALFTAIDGLHEASVNADGIISLGMVDVNGIVHFDNHVILDTGSPHYVQWVANTDEVDVYGMGKAIRNKNEFQPNGINVNFVQRTGEGIRVRTYERGVEDETLSCGTGVTAAAIASTGAATGVFCIPVETPGGSLEVSFRKHTADTATMVVLKGPATYVFEGTFDLNAI